MNLLQYIKQYKKNSLLLRNYSYIFLLVVIPIAVVSGIMYYNMSTSLKSEIMMANQNDLEKVSLSLENVLTDVKLISASMESRYSLEAFVVSNEEYQKNSMGEITKFMKIMEGIYEYIDSIYVYSARNDKIITSANTFRAVDPVKDGDWMQAFYNDGNEKMMIIPQSDYEKYPYLLSLVNVIYSNSKKKQGMVIININIETLGDIIFKNAEGVYHGIDILNTDDMILYSEDKSSMYHRFAENPSDDNIVISKESENAPIRYVCNVSMDNYHNNMKQLLTYILLVVGIVFLIGLIVSSLISIRAFQPIDTIVDTINRERYDGETLPGNLNEVSYIITNIAKTVKHGKELEVQLSENLIRLRNLQIAVLQAQINPHFLYNTLSMINWSAIEMSGGANKVSDMIVLLSDVCKRMIGTDEYLTTVKEEVESAKSYVEILKLRYKNMMNVTWDIDERAYECAITKFCLQPLIENAMYHGIKPTHSEGEIIVSIKKLEKGYELRVQDNGVGMTQKQVNELLAFMDNLETTDRAHVGIKNVNSRLKLVFGDAATMKIKSAPGEGTTVMIVNNQQAKL